MAQTVSHGMATSMVSTPFPLPPGLDTANGTGGAAASAADALASSVAGAASATRQAAHNDNGASNSKVEHPRSAECQAILDEVRRSVLEEVETKVAEKMKVLWTKGNNMIKKAEEESQQKNATIMAELEQCREKQEALQTEHEHLKTLVASMVQQFSVLGGYFGGLAGPKIASPTPCTLAALAATNAANGTTTATETQANSSSASAASTIQDSPATEFSAAGFAAAGTFPPLPAVPDFPFPASPAAPTPTPSAATPLSLAEALASDTPSPSVPVSLMGSLPPPSQSQRIFSFTLRKADGTELGLNVTHHEDDKALRVEGVRPEGAVEAWNRQCIGSVALREKAVCRGDRIVSVNGVINDPAKMLEECRDKQLLKLTVIRGEAAASLKTTSLRADASEFVPSGAPPSGGLGAIIEQPEQPAKDDAEADAASSTEKETEC